MVVLEAEGPHMTLYRCSHPRCDCTTTVTSKAAEKIAKQPTTSIWHECLRAKKELRRMRPVT